MQRGERGGAGGVGAAPSRDAELTGSAAGERGAVMPSLSA